MHISIEEVLRIKFLSLETKTQKSFFAKKFYPNSDQIQTFWWPLRNYCTLPCVDMNKIHHS